MPRIDAIRQIGVRLDDLVVESPRVGKHRLYRHPVDRLDAGAQLCGAHPVGEPTVQGDHVAPLEVVRTQRVRAIAPSTAPRKRVLAEAALGG